jgi:osmotically-inducible protein OsmY
VLGGRVTLTGQVIADASVGTMAYIAARVNGATEVINMIRTLPDSPQDDAIRHEIGRLFYEDPIFASDAYETRVPIRIIVEHGRVMLTGAVASAAARHTAEIIARAVGGVIDIDNRLVARSNEAAVGVSSSKPEY